MSRPSVDELQGARPDPNPHIPCDECGEKFRFRDYWQERVIDGDRIYDPVTRDDTWRCDDCHEEHKRQQRRKQNNRTILEYGGRDE